MFVLRGLNDSRSCGAEVVEDCLVMVPKAVVILWGCAVGKYESGEMFRVSAGGQPERGWRFRMLRSFFFLCQEHCQGVDHMFDAFSKYCQGIVVTPSSSNRCLRSANTAGSPSDQKIKFEAPPIWVIS